MNKWMIKITHPFLLPTNEYIFFLLSILLNISWKITLNALYCNVNKHMPLGEKSTSGNFSSGMAL